jgi:hypothetical protein
MWRRDTSFGTVQATASSGLSFLSQSHDMMMPHAMTAPGRCAVAPLQRTPSQVGQAFQPPGVSPSRREAASPRGGEGGRLGQTRAKIVTIGSGFRRGCSAQPVPPFSESAASFGPHYGASAESKGASQL